mmetsp:Transcript_66441/g.130295  ORF Transcript_66441/g.130295 Transcript_66441/m.130295 type:complete len:208 (-) Transcript_66441:1120-1743(-)
MCYSTLFYLWGCSREPDILLQGSAGCRFLCETLLCLLPAWTAHVASPAEVRRRHRSPHGKRKSVHAAGDGRHGGQDRHALLHAFCALVVLPEPDPHRHALVPRRDGHHDLDDPRNRLPAVFHVPAVLDRLAADGVPHPRDLHGGDGVGAGFGRQSHRSARLRLLLCHRGRGWGGHTFLVCGGALQACAPLLLPQRRDIRPARLQEQS